MPQGWMLHPTVRVWRGISPQSVTDFELGIMHGKSRGLTHRRLRKPSFKPNKSDHSEERGQQFWGRHWVSNNWKFLGPLHVRRSSGK